MSGMGRLLQRLFFIKQRKEPINVEELRIAFRSRYHHFKLLLTANNKALDIMAEMEEALRGTRTFGMSFVQSRCTTILTNVWLIIKHLNELAPGKYEGLYNRFKEIQQNINSLIQHKGSAAEGPLVLPLESIGKEMADQTGSKIANLGEVKNRMHLNVSNGFAVTARGYERFMEANDLSVEIDRRIQAADLGRPEQLYSLSADIQQLIIRSSLPEDLESAISAEYRTLEEKEGNGVSVAMRSSALGEDLAGISFAGQYRSILNVRRENIFDAYKEVIAGKYGLPAMTYRLNRGIRDEDAAMCVACMAMVDAASGGVIYSRNPVNISDHAIFINAVWGLPKSVVDGTAASDLFVVSRDEPMKVLRKEILKKEIKYVCYPSEGICRTEVTDDESGLPSLGDEQAAELAHLAVRMEEYYGVPQDIEWAITADGSIIVLQCRPLQQREVTKITDVETLLEEEPGSVIVRGGLTAGPGAAAGPVTIVKKDVDSLRFPEGGVLVSSQSLPRWATLLNRAAAVVTEQGSVAGHLASVAREFGVPALFGVKGAIDLLKNEEWVTVDADGLRIYKGRIDALLKKQPEMKNLMEGSPVFETLKGAASHIIPLNLLDPGAPEFTPRSCKTLHDITRFCHEKVVEEMFSFGKEHRFPERSSKQLFCKVPMQWWVLNLDDGFQEEVKGRYVRLENIASIPMLALWEGITAVPWEGPPPVDGKGFMSVMFQATTNRALVPGVRSQYANRNYFMISKNYCSLNSRLGFHFSTIETLVSDRSSENYIGFQFKGGAADDNRKHKRVLLVKDILEEHGFRVDVKEDSLIARMEGHEKEFIKQSLNILGYLTMHTRQLDMIMANNDSVQYYRSKINKDISGILSFQGKATK